MVSHLGGLAGDLHVWFLTASLPSRLVLEEELNIAGLISDPIEKRNAQEVKTPHIQKEEENGQKNRFNLYTTCNGAL